MISHLVVPVIFVASAGGLFEDDVRLIGKSLDRNTAAIVEGLARAVDAAAEESEEVRSVAEKFRQDLSRLPPKATAQGMLMTEFLVDQAKQNADALAEITGLLKDRNYVAALKAFAALQQRAAGNGPPKVGTVNPESFRMMWMDHERSAPADPKVTTLEFWGYGWNPDDAAKCTVELRDARGKKLRTVSDHLVIDTSYLAQIDVAVGSGINFNDGETRLVLLYDNKVVSAVPITWGMRPKAPPVPPAIRNIRVVLYTDSHKEKGGQVEQTFYYNRRPWGTSEHWWNKATNEKIHPGAHAVWEKGHKHVFEPPDGLKFRPSYHEGDVVRVDVALGATPGQANINWRGNIEFIALLSDGREVPIGKSGGFWFRNNRVEEPVEHRGDRTLEFEFALPPLP